MLLTIMTSVNNLVLAESQIPFGHTDWSDCQSHSNTTAQSIALPLRGSTGVARKTQNKTFVNIYKNVIDISKLTTRNTSTLERKATKIYQIIAKINLLLPQPVFKDLQIHQRGPFHDILIVSFIKRIVITILKSKNLQKQNLQLILLQAGCVLIVLLKMVAAGKKGLVKL